MSRLLVRARNALVRHGARGLVRVVAGRVWRRVAVAEEHVWYELSLAEIPTGPGLEPPVRLVRADPGQLDLVVQLDRDALTAHEYAARGHELFLALDGERPVFGCWIHHGEAPMLAARGGWLTLPDRIVCLEDSVTASDQRGKGIAPRAWRDLASRLSNEGARAMITKVSAGNAASRKAVLKAGFVEIGVMRYGRKGRTQHVQFEVLGDSATGALLRDRLQR